LLLLYPAIIAAFSPLYAQSPLIEWQKTIGGTSQDDATAVCSSPGGGFIVVTNSSSTNGDLNASYGQEDIWALKFDSSGSLLWKKHFGGSLQDIAKSVVALKDGYIIAGYTASNDHDLAGNHGTNGSTDYWILKIDLHGNNTWSKCFGGSDYDYANSIDTTADGGFIVTGMSSSRDGDVTGDHGNGDCWMVKLTASGAITWERSVGGVNPDVGNCVKTDRDGNYAVFGFSFSADADVAQNNRSGNAWLFKISTVGGMQWQRSFGGDLPDYGQQLMLTKDGGYALAAYAYSHVAGNHGSADYYVIKLNGNGDTEWQYYFGGDNTDIATGLVEASSGGFLVIGYSASNSGDFIGSKGNEDGWLLKIDASGKKEWVKSLGGTADDRLNGLITTPGGGYVLVGSTKSVNGDVTGSHGNADAWILKLGCEPLQAEISITTNYDTICTGTKAVFTASIKNGGDAPVFQWKKNGMNAGVNKASYEDASVVNGDSISCMLTSNYSCASVSIVNSNSIIIKTKDPVAAQVNISTASSSVCKGSEVIFYATSPAKNSASVFTWFVNGKSLPGTTDTILYPGLQDNDKVSVSMVSNSYCILNLPVSSNTLIMKVANEALPEISISASVNPVCRGEEVRFVANPANATNAAYTWIVNGLANGSTGKEFTSTVLKDNDVIKCRITAGSTCVATVESNSIQMHVKEIPGVVCMQDTTIFEGTTITLRANISADVVSYQWTPPASIQNSNGPGPALAQPNETTLYRLNATNSTGCSASDEVLVTVIRGGVIPNAFSPNHDGINDDWRLPFAVSCNGCFVQVFDRYGVLVYSAPNYNTPWNGTKNNKPVPVGVYYYFIKKETGKAPLSGSLLLVR